MHRLSVQTILLSALTALAVACGGDDKNDNNNGDSDNTTPDATQAQAGEAFRYYAQSVQVAFAAGQNNQTPAATGFTFSTPATKCGLNGTYTITGTGVLADSGNPSAGGTYQFTTTWAQCAPQTYAIDGTADETATISQTSTGGTTFTDERLKVTSDHLGFATIANLQATETFNCPASSIDLHVQVNQIGAAAPTQTVSGTGTWCGFTWDNSFVGDFQFVPQSH